MELPPENPGELFLLFAFGSGWGPFFALHFWNCGIQIPLWASKITPLRSFRNLKLPPSPISVVKTYDNRFNDFIMDHLVHTYIILLGWVFVQKSQKTVQNFCKIVQSFTGFKKKFFSEKSTNSLLAQSCATLFHTSRSLS